MYLTLCPLIIDSWPITESKNDFPLDFFPSINKSEIIIKGPKDSFTVYYFYLVLELHYLQNHPNHRQHCQILTSSIFSTLLHPPTNPIHHFHSFFQLSMTLFYLSHVFSMVNFLIPMFLFVFDLTSSFINISVLHFGLIEHFSIPILLSLSQLLLLSISNISISLVSL